MDAPPALPPPELNLDNLKARRLLGKGATGTVFLVQDPKSDHSPFALKVVEKSTSQKSLERRARWEIDVLGRLSHPFLPRLIGSSETNDYLCYAIPYCSGGDLNTLRYRQNDGVFSTAAIRFYLAEIICALEHLHEKGIAYRDLKPENVLLQQHGHITLTDFDLSRQLKRRSAANTDVVPEPLGISRKSNRNLTRLIRLVIENNAKTAKSARVSPVSRRKPSFSDGERSNSFVGTDEYVSPEVVKGEGHEFAVDWWALGVLSYEMMYGTTPFKGRNKKETFRNILMQSPEFLGQRTALTDLIGRLLEKDPTKRLGYRRGASEIKEHKFFGGVRWDLLTEVLRPPVIPSREEGDVTADGFNIREYFQKLRAPPSPLTSPSVEYTEELSEF